MISRAICPILVGRQDELSTLEDALLAACRGGGSVVVLSGDAGMGKSRLCGELERRAEKIGAAVMEGSCSEADLALPYLPFLEAIGNHLQTSDVSLLSARLGVHARQLAALFPQLSDEGTEPAAATTPDARLRLFEAVLALLRLASEAGGLLLVVEDLHWADASTRELLDYLTRRLRNTRILVLATYRRDEMHRKHPLLPTVQSWQRSRLAQMVELEPLEPEGVAQMVSAIFDDTQVGSEFRDFIHQRSEGNPFVLEEMLKAALERGDIFREGDDWQRKPLGDLHIPETVRDTILMRLERLDPAQIDIVRCAAVLGRSFDYQILIDVAGQARSAVEEALQAAALQQLLEEDRAAAGRYRFRHALTQEAVYDDLSAPLRERLHAAAADALAERPGAVSELAYHLRAAHRWAEAAPATLRAAEAAEASYGYGEAAELYEQLLALVSSGIERARVLCRLGEALWRATRLKAAIEPLEEGIGDLEAAREPLEAARHRLTLGRCYWEMGRLGEAEEAYELARTVLEGAGPSRDLALAYVRLAGIEIFNFRAEAGRALAERAIATARDAGADDMRIWALNFLGVATAYLGDYPAGIELLDQSATEAAAAGLPEIAGNALHNLVPTCMGGGLLRRLPELADRLERLQLERWSVDSQLFARMFWAFEVGQARRGLDYAQELHARGEVEGNTFSADAAGRAACICLVELDRLDEARHWLPPRREEADAQDRAGQAWVRLQLHWAAGDRVQALEEAEAVLARIDDGRELDAAAEASAATLIAVGRVDDAAHIAEAMQRDTAPTTRVVGDVVAAMVAAARERPKEALAPLEAAVAWLDERHYALLAIRARRVLADLHELDSDRAGALAELQKVLETSDRLGLALRARQARERLAELGIVINEPVTRESKADAPVAVGERLVTVLFADVRGYTAMTGQTAPAEMLDKIAAYQRWAAQEVERHLGTVDKFAGDAVMATFNVSGARVDHAQHAYLTAQALRDKAALLGLPVGVGIATGAAVVGRLQEGANLSVLGTTTNLAARLQAQAGAGEILLSEETRHRLPDVDGDAEMLELKGFDQPVKAYRVGVASRSAPAR